MHFLFIEQCYLSREFLSRIDKKSFKPIKFVIGRKSREVMGYNYGKVRKGVEEL